MNLVDVGEADRLRRVGQLGWPTGTEYSGVRAGVEVAQRVDLVGRSPTAAAACAWSTPSCR